MSVWQPIASAPRDGTPIIVCWDINHPERDMKILSFGWHDGQHPYTEPSHWLPLPAKIEDVPAPRYKDVS